MSSEIALVAVQPGESAEGASEEARFVKNMEDELQNNLRSAVSIGSPLNKVVAEIKDVIAERSLHKEKGRNYAPLKQRAQQDAFRLANVIPLGFPPPMIGAEPDGDITFEWYKNPNWTLSVSVDGQGNLHYAALLGADCAYGTEAFVGLVPRRILDLVYAVTSR
jgi:hypothetical protein